MGRNLRTILTWVLLAGLAAAALITVSPGDVARLAAFIVRQPGACVLAAAAYAAAFGLRALAWQALLPGPGGGPPFLTLWRLGLVANLVNHLAPGKLGEVARMFLAERQGLPRAVAVASVVHVRLVDTIALLAVAVPALAWSLPGLEAGNAAAVAPAPAAGALRGWLVAAIVVAAFGMAVLVVVRLLAPRLARKWPRLGAFTRPLAEVPFHRLAVACLASAASWPLEAGILAVVGRGLGVDLDPAALVATTLVAVAGQVISLTPGGLGTYEANMTLVLQLYGVPPALAFQVGLFTHLAKYLFAIAAGLEPAWRLAGGPARLLSRLRE